MTGYEVCESLRQQNISAPIIILSAETKILSKISLLDAGANDYLTKPFSLGELKVRIRALIRNSTAVIAKPNNIVFEDLELDSSKRSVIRAGQIISLRRKEFALLECLIQNAGDAVSRKKLIRHAWTEADSPWKNTIDVHIKYLRDKVDKPFGFDLIRTVHGYGYRLAPNPALPRKR